MIDASSCPFADVCPAVAVILDETAIPEGPVKKVCKGCNKDKEDEQ